MKTLEPAEVTLDRWLSGLPEWFCHAYNHSEQINGIVRRAAIAVESREQMLINVCGVLYGINNFREATAMDYVKRSPFPPIVTPSSQQTEVRG